MFIPLFTCQFVSNSLRYSFKEEIKCLGSPIWHPKLFFKYLSLIGTYNKPQTVLITDWQTHVQLKYTSNSNGSLALCNLVNQNEIASNLTKLPIR